MTSPYNYCPKCGDALSERESQLASEMVREANAPPMCQDCFVEIFEGVAQSICDVIDSGLRGMSECLKPLATDIGDNEEP